MNINHINGDLFSTHDQLIAHGCNTYGVMGAGVATIIKDKYPKAFEVYNKTCLNVAPQFQASLLGDIIPYRHERDSRRTMHIINMLTQHQTGRDKSKRYVSYDAVDIAFGKLFRYMDHHEIWSASIPKIGAGLANGEWDVIEEIIYSQLKKFHQASNRQLVVNVWSL